MLKFIKLLFYIPVTILKVLITPFCVWLGYKYDEGKSMAECDNPFNWYGPYQYPGNPYARERDIQKYRNDTKQIKKV